MEKKVFQARMVSTIEAAELFSVSTGTLQNWRSLKVGPRYFKMGRKILYKLDDLEAFFMSTPVLPMEGMEAGHDHRGSDPVSFAGTGSRYGTARYPLRKEILGRLKKPKSDRR